MTSRNPFLLAADNDPQLLPLLRETPALSSAQDEHGYSLVHAAASYNHLDLLRTLIQEFNVDVNIKDEDNDTALFVVETPEAARALIDLGVDVNHRADDGLTARERLEAEAEFPQVVAFLNSILEPAAANVLKEDATEALRQAPQGMKITVSTMNESEDIPSEVDPDFRRRIEELAQRADFDAPEGQADLRKLVEEALLDRGLAADRNVRQKQE